MRTQYERKGREEKKKGRATRAYPCTYTHAPALAHTLATVERPLTLHFVVGVFFFMRPIASLFQHPFYHPPALGPYTPRPSSRLTRPVKKKEPCIFCPSCFLHDSAIRRPTWFLRPFFPGTVYPPLFTMQIKAGPFPLSPFFMAQACVGRLAIQKIVEPSTLVHPNEDAFRSLSRKIYSKSRDL